MSAITQSYKIDMTSGAVPLRIKVSQYDAGIRQLTFWLYNLGTKLTSSQLSSLTAYVQGTKEDQKGFEYECTAGFSSEGCYVDVDITEQMTACAGDVVCELVLTAEDVRIGSTNFVLEVEKAALGADTDISETELPDIIDAGRRYAAAAEEAAERAEEAAASTSAGAAIGNVTGVDNSTVDTNIDLGRDLVEGDRILLYVGNKITEPRNVITYKNGTAVTTSFGMLILPGFYISGLVMLEYQEDVMPDTYKWARVWMDEAVTYTAGTGISINGTTIYNSLPMRGDAFEEYEITTAVDDGDLGGFSDLVDYLLIRFKANAVPDNEDHYTCILGHSTPVVIRKAGILKDAAGSYFGDDIAAGTTLLCKADDGGDGTGENPIIVTVLAVLGVGGSGATSLAELTDTSISSPTNGQVLKYNSTSSKWENANESGGGADELNDLSDVAISTPSNGQVLKYNSTSGKWENGNESGGGGGEATSAKKRYTISSGSWSASQNASGYYTYSLTLTTAISGSPNVYLAGSTDSTHPTDTESSMYNLLDRIDLTSSTTLVLSAKTKPTSTFYVWVGCEGGGSDEVYSTSETVVGTWLNKTLYRMVVDTGALPNATNKDISIPALVGCKIVKLYGIAQATNNYVVLPLPFLTTGNSTAYVQLMAFTASNNAGVRITTGEDRTAFDTSYVVIEYTKS